MSLRQSDTTRSDDIFVNREGPLDIIMRAARSIPPDRAVIHVFHGPGGEGKTALLNAARQRLRQHENLHVITIDFAGGNISEPVRLAVRMRNLFK